jgi:anti-sigma B factor antagonist
VNQHANVPLLQLFFRYLALPSRIQYARAMSLQMEPREKEGITILALKGRLTMGKEDLALRQCLKSLCDAGKTKLILDLQHVLHIDTTGLGTLVFCSMKLTKAGGRLALIHLSPSHIELVVLLKLEGMFEIFADEQSAVDSFFPGRAIQHYDILSVVQRLAGDSK